jgi:serine/threonine-protein kinase
MEDPQNLPQSPVKPGDILAHKYRVEKVLGVGGMGVVVAAMHTELDERVALKFLLPSAAQNPSVVARFNREARAAVKIKSQHVARVSDVGTLDDGTPYIVMEHLEGKDLGDILEERGNIPFGLAVDYVLQACEAIAEAHAAGIVHRDLKPPNLFLARQADGTSIVKVLDFGISKAVLVDEPSGNHGGITGTTDVFGSPTYMSPEQLKASRDVDARADVWALGVILYEFIAGKAPFERPTVAETFGSILYETPVPLRKLRPDVPEPLERAIMQCLEKDIAARTPNIADLSKALFPYAENGSQASLDRTSRILKRAGVAVASAAPESRVLAAAKTTLDAGQAGALGSQTRSAWGAASQIPKPRGSRATVVIGVLAGMIVVGGAGALLLRRAAPATVVVPMQAERPPAVAPPSQTSVPAMTVASSAVPAVPAVPAPPPLPAVSAPPAAVSTAPTPNPGKPVGSPTTLGKAGRGAANKRGAPTTPTTTAPGAPAPAPPPAPPPPPPPPPKAPDGDDFGDRK